MSPGQNDSGWESSTHCNIRKHKQIDKSHANEETHSQMWQRICSIKKHSENTLWIQIRKHCPTQHNGYYRGTQKLLKYVSHLSVKFWNERTMLIWIPIWLEILVIHLIILLLITSVFISCFVTQFRCSVLLSVTLFTCIFVFAAYCMSLCH